MIWKRCIFCGEEIFSIKYKPLQLTLDGITEDESTKVILMGDSHKSCRDHFLFAISKLCSDFANYPIEKEDSYIQ